jgi:hypothetical protein
MRYRYGHTLSQHSWRRYFFVLIISLAIIAALAGLIIWNSKRPHAVIRGGEKLIPQTQNKIVYTQLSESDYTFELPSDWKQISQQDTATVHSVGWQATAKNEDNRYLTIYTDPVPSTYAVNRELPLTAHGNQLSAGTISGNCSSFTPGGSTDVAVADKLKPAPSVWHSVHFICNLPQFVDNQIGTGSLSAINSVSVSGPASGSHNYFFLYIDRNVQPDDTILYNVIKSFRAK